jgi:hypothetical protein
MRRRLIEPPQVGELIPYWYLWRAEFEAGEESGRKTRPCAVVVTVKMTSGETKIAVVPVTHTKPPASRSAVELPREVKSRLGLDAARSWVICDEANEFTWPGYDIAKTPSGRPSFGFLPRGLLERIRAEFAAARARGAVKPVPRDEEDN